MRSKSFFSPEQTKQIVDAIAAAELNTSGEIRVHIEDKCKEEVLERAAQVFTHLKMHETELRNGVLIYLAVGDRKFAIAGDKGINEKVPADFWEKIKGRMLEQFKKGEFTAGLCEAIIAAGDQLKMHFPYKKGDKNELNNDVSFG